MAEGQTYSDKRLAAVLTQRSTSIRIPLTNTGKQLTEAKIDLAPAENRCAGMESKLENRLREMEKKVEEMQNRFEKFEGQSKEIHVVESARCSKTVTVDPSNNMKDTRNPKDNAYIVAGGYGKNGKPMDSVEIFNKTTNSWMQLEPMETCRADASSVVYNGQVLVTGGISNGNNILSTIDRFSRHPNPFVPPYWSNFPINLPRALSGHYNVLHNDRLIVLGGGDKDYADMIYEIQLQFPFTTKVLAQLPSPRPMKGCGVILVKDKIFIFGGCETSSVIPAAIANVTMYDITKNEVNELAPLPYKVRDMAIAKYKENVILAGGSDRSVRKDTYDFVEVKKQTVVSYNIETQKSVMLPKMWLKRSNCRAVVDGNSIVVIGGENQSRTPLTSVEAFDFKTTKWENLGSMNEARKGFMAEVV